MTSHVYLSLEILSAAVVGIRFSRAFRQWPIKGVAQPRLDATKGAADFDSLRRLRYKKQVENRTIISQYRATQG